MIQLSDRYGEPDRTAQLIAAGFPNTQYVVLNGDDPLVKNLAQFKKTTYIFSVLPRN